MRYYLIICVLLCAPIFTRAQTKNPAGKKYVLVIHGGAGTILRSKMTPEKEQLYKQGLQRALNAGSEILKNGHYKRAGNKGTRICG